MGKKVPNTVQGNRAGVRFRLSQMICAWDMSVAWNAFRDEPFDHLKQMGRKDSDRRCNVGRSKAGIPVDSKHLRRRTLWIPRRIHWPLCNTYEATRHFLSLGYQVWALQRFWEELVGGTRNSYFRNKSWLKGRGFTQCRKPCDRISHPICSRSHADEDDVKGRKSDSLLREMKEGKGKDKENDEERNTATQQYSSVFQECNLITTLFSKIKCSHGNTGIWHHR